MPRFGRFEVKREMRDAGTIRPDDEYRQNGGKSSLEQQKEINREANQVGFDDYDFEISEGTEEIKEAPVEIELDDNGNPVIPSNWTYITHGSSLDRWDPSLLGSDFVVGNGTANGKEVKGRPLCCVERNDAKFSYDRRGSTTAETYGGKQQAFEIRVLLYKNPRLAEGKSVRDKLTSEQTRALLKYYMYQDGRHPAVPVGTKLNFLKNGDFDDITNTNGNNILWYIPEQYLEQYLADVERMQQIGKEDKTPTITNSDVERELRGVNIDDLDVSTLKYYLAEKIPQVYGDRLGKAGIDIEKFLERQKLRLEYFEGTETYKEIIEELDSLVEFAERDREEDSKTPESEISKVEDSIEEKNSFLSTIQGQVVTSDEEYAKNVQSITREQDKRNISKAVAKKEER